MTTLENLLFILCITIYFQLIIIYAAYIGNILTVKFNNIFHNFTFQKMCTILQLRDSQAWNFSILWQKCIDKW